MTETRAETWIDSTRVRLKNAGFERHWTVFPGCTQELGSPGGVSWLREACPEFQVVAGDTLFAPEVLGHTEWSDAYTPFGASVTARYSNVGAAVEIETFAFHAHPAWSRRMTVINVSRNPLPLSRVVIEALPLARPGLRVYADAFAPAGERGLWRSKQPAAVADDYAGWIFQLEECGVYGLFEPDPALCILGFEPETVLGAGQSWTAPLAHGLCFTGALGDVVECDYAAFCETLRAMRQWQDDRRREAAEPIED